MMQVWMARVRIVNSLLIAKTRLLAVKFTIILYM